jgi:hypothetical protein
MDKMWITCRDCYSAIQFPDGFIPKEFYCLHCGRLFIPEEVRALIREAKQNGNK